MSRRLPAFWFSTTVLLAAAAVRADDLPPAPTATPAFAEDWSTGRIDPAKWYLPRKKWGDPQNHGVVPENVRIARDTTAGRERNVLICEAHGDQYDGPVVGQGGVKTRVGHSYGSQLHQPRSSQCGFGLTGRKLRGVGLPPIVQSQQHDWTDGGLLRCLFISQLQSP